MLTFRADFAAVLASLAAFAPPGWAQGEGKVLDPAAAVAEAVAEGTTPQRLGELYAFLTAADFAKCGLELARELGREKFFEFGMGWATKEPWLEPRLADHVRAFGTLHCVWDRHVQQPVDEAAARVLWQILDDESAGSWRYRAIDALLPHWGTEVAAAVLDPSLERIDRLALADATPQVRAYCLQALARYLAMDGYVDRAIEIARLAPDASREQDLLHATGIVAQVPVLAPVPRARLLRYEIALLSRLATGAPPGTALSLVMTLQAVLPAPLADAKYASTPEGMQQYVAHYRAYHAAGAPPAVPGEGVWPFVPVHEQFVQRVRGEATVQCRSQWRSLDDLPLAATAVWRFGPRELRPLLPAELPIAVGAKWTVRAEALAVVGQSLAEMSWIDASGGGAWGWAMHSRKVETKGELAATLELRDGRRGIAMTGALVLHETAAAASRFGPNDLRSESRYELTVWLPLDAHGAITGFEVQLHGNVAGRFGAESFSQRVACRTAPGPLLSPEEGKVALELVMELGKDDAAAAMAMPRLASMGPGLQTVLVDAIGRTDSFATRRRLTAVLRQFVGTP